MSRNFEEAVQMTKGREKEIIKKDSKGKKVKQSQDKPSNDSSNSGPDQGDCGSKSSLNTLNIDDEVINDAALLCKVSFVSNDIWQDENAGSSSASERNSMSSLSKMERLKPDYNKDSKLKKGKHFEHNTPNKKSALELKQYAQKLSPNKAILQASPRSFTNDPQNYEESIECRQSPMSDNKSIKNMEMVYHEQNNFIMRLQDELAKEISLRKKFENKAKIFNFPDPATLEAGSDQYILAKMAKDLELKSEECEVIVAEKSQEIHELKVSLDSQQAIICDQRNIISENEKEIASLSKKVEKLTKSNIEHEEITSGYLTEISQLKMKLQACEEVNSKIKHSKNSKEIITNLEKIIQEKNDEIENILNGCKAQQMSFQKSLDQQLDEIDAKNRIIEDLQQTNKNIEERVARLKQAVSGMHINHDDDEIDKRLSIEISLRKALTAARQENKILEDNLIDAKLQWASCEHQAARMKMDMVDMSEEIQYLRSKHV
ncbi:unnamed protein product [Moneuplotes crassus]|uniref:Uncharacterized protein n=1 Tax=Euplotes crassus TaxID=5936 RepID=A0AAD1U864_EUPCR|nr:unnamed protein product [Moneuplotes crassus]